MIGDSQKQRRAGSAVGLGLLAVLLAAVALIWPAAAADYALIDDGRSEFLGKWSCAGTSTVAGQSRPYQLKMHNRPDLQNHWLRLDMKEISSSAAQRPLQEIQYWSYTPQTLTHSRWGMDNSGNFGLITTPGWVDDRMVWNGYFQLEGVQFDYSEIVERVGGSREHHHWTGTLRLPDGPVIGQIDLDCLKQE